MPGSRSYGMDHDLYKWSPIVSRPVLKWPNGSKVAVAVVVNLEHWDWEVPKGTPLAVGPLGGPDILWGGNDPQFPDIGGYGNHEYGNRVGVFRVFSVLKKYGIRPTLALDATVARNYPRLVEEGHKLRGEFIAHGISRRLLIHSEMSEAEETRYIHESIDSVAKATGAEPRGWCGADFQETERTSHLLAAAGIDYVCDFGNDEQPYKMTPKVGELYSLGINLYLDDGFVHLRGRRTMQELSLLWRDWFDGLNEDGAVSGRMMVLNVHPWIMGQPWRIRYLDEVLSHICSQKSAWLATGSEIIDAFKGQAG